MKLTKHIKGSSGAGKTTLLDCLASRVSTGVVTGDMFVDGKLRDNSFQRQTGYVQQQDLHLETSTVREALTFSALLRQSNEYSHQEKLDYVETVISLLEMEDYEHAIVGVLGQGLNVEQRKRLTIGVELAARPRLLLFLDEPTSGLDSQTSWSICNLMRKLTDNGQAILCTIHQPSAMLFQRFDRLLLLARGGRTVYFGDIGVDSRTLIDYLVRNGAPKCEEGVNPAEYILQVIGAAAGSKTEIEWPEVWQRSQELVDVKTELKALKVTRVKVEVDQMEQEVQSSGKDTEFAASFSSQMNQVLKRLLQQYWRSPSYIYSKAILSVGSVSSIPADGPVEIYSANISSQALFIGMSYFSAERTQMGIQNQQFGVFLLLIIFGTVIEQMVPVFVAQRTLYEARERSSKTYSWQVFVASCLIVEVIWNSVRLTPTLWTKTNKTILTILTHSSWVSCVSSAGTTL
jgi:ABC-type multidrug transport system ATPase subunit